MANSYIDSSLLDRAIVFAVRAHANTERRGKGFPYIVHPMEAVEIVSTMTSDQELLAAAALHDTVEDTDVTLEQIRAEFGDRIASIVESESDEMEGADWRSRKQAAIDRLAAASLDAQMVAMGDKLSNMRAIARDYAVRGEDLWKIFHAPDPSDHEWHYRGLAQSLRALADTCAYKEFVSLIHQVWPDAPSERPSLIDISEYEQSGDGYTAISYNHKDGSTMIKLYSSYIPTSVPARELAVAQKVMSMGIPTPRSGRFITDGSRVGAEFERISPKKSFARSISQDPSCLNDMAVRFARMCKELHSTPCDTVFFESARDHFRDAVASCRDITPEMKARAMEVIASTPSATTCVHGDMHIGNVITDGREDYWIDLGDFRFGHPLFDLGMFYLTCKLSSEEMTQRLFHVSCEQMAEVWRVFCSEYFPGEALEDVNARVAPYAALHLIFFGNRDKMYPFMLDAIRTALSL